MNSRRCSAAVVVWLVAAVCVSQLASAATSFPNRPIRIIQGFSAGGISDTLARVVGDKVGERLGQPVVVESRPGGGGVVGMRAATEATADGYTLLLGNAAITISPNRKEKLPFDPMKAFVPVSMIGTSPSILLANAAAPVSSIQELIAYAKARPGKVDCATSGIGTSNDLGVHLLNYMTGIKIMNVPYKGSGPSLTAVLGNETPLSFAPLLPAIPPVKQGRIKALGVSSLKRNQALPEVPAIAETVAGYEDVGFYSIVAPSGVAKSTLELLHREFNRALALPEVQKQLAKFGVDVAIMTRDEFANFIARDAKRWKDLVRDAQLAL